MSRTVETGETKHRRLARDLVAAAYKKHAYEKGREMSFDQARREIESTVHKADHEKDGTK